MRFQTTGYAPSPFSFCAVAAHPVWSLGKTFFADAHALCVYTMQYLFFGILEPISVLAGAYYALVLPERYNHELIPPAFFPASTLQSSLRQAGVLTDATRMALGQLGSCYLLIMLNSALMFYALRKFLRGRNDEVLERLVRYLIVVLGVADCKSSPAPPCLACRMGGM